MAAIDLLFDAKGNSERLHQTALGPLLAKTRLLNEIGVQGRTKGEFAWEPDGGKFDLSVALQEKGDVLVEIKVDSHLSKRQWSNQLDAMSEKDHSPSVLYLLLGHAQHYNDPTTLLERIEEDFPAQRENVYVVTGKELTEMLEDCAVKTSGAHRPQDVHDLAIAYREALLNLNNRTGVFEEKEVSDWKYGDYLGFFEACRSDIPAMSGAGIGYVSNPRGGFPGCWWGYKELSDDPYVQLYAQFERSKLCYKVRVDDKSKQSEYRNTISKMVRDLSEDVKVNAQRPDRFGKGQTMTVAIAEDFLPDDQISWTSMRSKLKHATDVIDRVSL